MPNVYPISRLHLAMAKTNSPTLLNAYAWAARSESDPIDNGIREASHFMEKIPMEKTELRWLLTWANGELENNIKSGDRDWEFLSRHFWFHGIKEGKCQIMPMVDIF